MRPPHAIVPILTRLETSGRVSRQRSRMDARVVPIFLTPEGRALKQAMGQMQREVAYQTGLSTKDFFDLRDRLYRLVETTDQNRQQEKAIG